MESQPYFLCPRCHRPVEPKDPEVEYAVEYKTLRTMGGQERVPGMGGFFHPGCFPPLFGDWQLAPKP